MKRIHFFILTPLLVVILFLSNGFAQDYVHYATLTESLGIIWNIVFSPDGRTLAAGCKDSNVYLWDVATGTHRKTLIGHITGSVYSVNFSPDGRTLASGGYDGTIRLWDVAADTHSIIFTGHTEVVHSLSFSPDGRTLAGGSNGRTFESLNITTVRLWNLATGALLKTFKGRGNQVSFSSDGRTLASWSAMDNTISFSDVATGTLHRSLNISVMNLVSFSPDGRMLASWSGTDNAISLWDIATSKLHKVFSNDSNLVSFSPDGNILVGGNSDGTIHLWDPASGTHLKTLEGHTDSVYIVSFSQDSSTLASVSLNKKLKTTIRLWKLPSSFLTKPDSPTPLKPAADHIYNNTIRSVMWIVNPGIGEGSGVLIDKQFKLAVTNAHITGAQNTVDIYFPAPDENGELIRDRNFYLTSKGVLKRLGYHTKGHVVAKNEKTDLAIIKLEGLPETAREIDWNFTTSTTNAGDLVYILGNPGGQKLWRWTLGEFLNDHGDFLHIQSDVFGGNSGGPVLNKQGTLIGIVARSDRHMNALAIPVRDINRLLSKSQLGHSRVPR